jgi:ATP-dependent exoDNAse (exonuclease V) beta subunit
MLGKIYPASAGTGKTTTIVNEFLNGVNHIDELKEKMKKTVFITFSNSATDEIKSKLWNKIKEKFTLNEPFVFNIFTIHSFCLRILKFLHHDFYLPADIDFLPSDDKERNTIWNICVDEYFENITDFEILNFLKLIDEENCKNFLKRYGFLIYALNELGYSDQKEAIPEQFKNLNNEKINEWIILKSELEDSEKNKGKANLTKIKDASEYLTYLNIKGKDVFKKIVREIAQNIYLKKIYIEGVLDYDTAVFLVVKKIKELSPNEFFSKLKNNGWEIENIYIDEAQDNDVLQNHLVIELAKIHENDENKLKYPNEPVIHIIGDYKQSIYQWRDAHPEEFKKIIEESKNANPEKIQKLNVSKRICNKKTLDYINEIFKKTKEIIGKNWHYDENEDKLEFDEKRYQNHNENKNNPTITIFNFTKENKSRNIQTIPKNLKINETDIKNWLKEKNKKIGILVRSRSYLNYIKNILNDIDAKYRIQEITSFEDLKNDPYNFYPEYMLVRPLFILFDYKKRYLLTLFLFFTLPGRILYEKLKGEEVKKLNSFEELYRELHDETNDLLSKLLEEYGYKTIIPTIYDILYYKDIIETINHLDYTTENEEKIKNIFRQINSLLYLIYLSEKQLKVLPIGEIIEKYLNNPPLPPTWYALQEDLEKNNDNIIEITTIHSSKGLTYDKILIIANFEKDFLSDYPDYKNDPEIYEFLFDVKFNQLLQTSPSIQVDYFPYIIMKYLLRDTENPNLFPKFLTDLFNRVKTRIHNEKLNLLYVALTRTKKDILIFNETEKKKKNNNDNFNEIFNNQHCTYETTLKLEEINRKNITFIYKKLTHPPLPKPKPYYTTYPITSLKDMDKLKFVRSAQLKHKIGAWNNYLHILVGITLHEIIRNYIQKGNDIYEIKNILTKGEIKQMIENILSNSKNELNKIDLIKNKSPNLETPILGKGKNDNELIQGIIDCFYIENNQVLLFDYKTLFCHNLEDLQQEIKEIKKQYQNQIENYRDLLIKLLNIDKTNTYDDSLILFKYVRENDQNI